MTAGFVLAALLTINAVSVSAQSGQPPIIDRELFFGDPEISGAQISPDGKFIAFIKPFKGTRNVWVKHTEDPFDKAKPITADTTRPIPAYFWSRDGKYIPFLRRLMDQTQQDWELRKILRALKGMSGADARQLRLHGIRFCCVPAGFSIPTLCLPIHRS